MFTLGRGTVYYEDEYLLVINKPAGMLVHPTVKEDGSTLTVDASQAGVLTADGRSISLRRLAEDDLVQVFGDYSGSRFTATLVIQL